MLGRQVIKKYAGLETVLKLENMSSNLSRKAVKTRRVTSEALHAVFNPNDMTFISSKTGRVQDVWELPSGCKDIGNRAIYKRKIITYIKEKFKG